MIRLVQTPRPKVIYDSRRSSLSGGQMGEDNRLALSCSVAALVAATNWAGEGWLRPASGRLIYRLSTAAAATLEQSHIVAPSYWPAS